MGSDMVKRGSKEIFTVDIEKEIYDICKKKAELGRYTVKEYINNILRRDTDRTKILLKSMPNLSMGGYQKNKFIFVNDKNADVEDGVVDVYVGARGDLYCELCQSYDCEHAQFAALQPEASELIKHDKKHESVY